MTVCTRCGIAAFIISICRNNTYSLHAKLHFSLCRSLNQTYVYVIMKKLQIGVQNYLLSIKFKKHFNHKST